MMLISYIISMFSMLLGVGFFTLLERKVLGFMQVRVGPSKVGYVGLFQVLADGLKLFSKEMVILGYSNKIIFGMAFYMGLFMCLLSWCLYINFLDCMDSSWGLLLFLCFSIGNVYVVMLSGWSSNSMYGMIGSGRGMAQAVSYEVIMALLILGSVMSGGSYSLSAYVGELFLGFCSVLGSVWFSALLAEMNRSPYDFAEGESELVSGFNVEYSSVGFSLLFMGEYGGLSLGCYVMGVMMSGDCSGVMSLLLGFLVIWVRGSFPRTRYDKLMSMAWKFYLSFCLGYLVFLSGAESLMEGILM